MARIVVVGSLNFDVSVRVARPPRPGETVLASAARAGPGGKGANQAVAAARLGAQAAMVGCVGDDPFGRALVENLDREGVDTSGVRVVHMTTGIALITVDATGENTIIVAPGANSVRFDVPDFPDADAVLTQGESEPAVIAGALDAARVGILNAAPTTDGVVSLARRADVVIANESEAARLPPGGGLTVVTLGSRGALATRREERWEVPAPKVTVVDTVGAGDAFCAAFAVALAEGAEVGDALRFAVTAGALAVTKPGAAEAMPRRVEVEELLSRDR